MYVISGKALNDGWCKIGMCEEVWYHALQYLDHCKRDDRSDEDDWQRFYSFQDPTGILNQHKNVCEAHILGNDGSQAAKDDLKFRYMELIRLLQDYEDNSHPSGSHRQYKDVTKLQGYQDWTNRLQWSINQKLFDKVDKLESTINEQNVMLENLNKVIMANDEKVDDKICTFVNETNERIVSFDKATDNLNDKYDSMKKVLDEVVNDEKLLVEKFSDLSEVTNSLHGKLETEQANNVEVNMKLKKDIEQIENSIVVISTDVDKYKSEFQTEIEKLSAQNSEIEHDMNRANETICKEVDEMRRDSVDGMKNDEERIRGIEMQLVQQEEKISNCGTDLASCRQDIVQLNDENHDKSSKIYELNEKVSVFPILVDKLTDKLNSLKDESQSLFDDMKKQMHDTNESHNCTHEKLESNFDEISTKISDIGNIIASYANDLSDINNRCDKNGEQRVIDIDNIREHIENVKLEIETLLNKEVDDLKSVMTQMNLNESKYLYLNDKIASLEELQTSFQQNMNILKDEHVKVEDDVETLKVNTDELHVFKDNIVRSIDDNKCDVQTRLSQLADNVQKISDDFDNMGSRMDSMRDDSNDQLSRVVDSTTTITNGIAKKVENLQEEVQAVGNMSKDNLGKLINLEEAFMNTSAKANQVEMLNEKIMIMNDDKQRRESELDISLGDLANRNGDALNDIRHSLEKRLDSLSNSMENHDDQLTHLFDKIENSKSKIEDIDMKKADKQNIQDTLDEIFIKLHDTVKESTQRSASIDSKIGQMEDVFRHELSRNNEELDIIGGKVRGINDLIESRSQEQSDIMKRNKIDVEEYVDDKVRNLDATLDTKLHEIDDIALKTENINEKFASELSEKVDELKKLTVEQIKDLSKENSEELSRLECLINGNDEARKTEISCLKEAMADHVSDAREKVEILATKLNDTDEITCEMKYQLNDSHVHLKEEIFQKFGDIDTDVSENISQLKFDLQTLKEKDEDKNCNIKQIVDQINVIDDDTKQQWAELDKRLSTQIMSSERQLQSNITETKFVVWKVINEFHTTFELYTIVLSSNGNGIDQQNSCFGVYRMIDHHCGRPVYRQDHGDVESGDHVLYFNEKWGQWIVSARVGDTYGWIKSCFNTSDNYGDCSALALLSGKIGGEDDDHDEMRQELGKSATWAYQLKDQAAHVDCSHSWRSDDPTLRFRPLQDVQNLGHLLDNLRTTNTEHSD